jgi:hypothetical protein
MKYEPSDQALIWIVDPSPCRSFEDRELDMSNFIEIRNPEIVMCEISTEPKLSDQYVIYTVDPTHDNKPRQLGTCGTIR